MLQHRHVDRPIAEKPEHAGCGRRSGNGGIGVPSLVRKVDANIVEELPAINLLIRSGKEAREEALLFIGE